MEPGTILAGKYRVDRLLGAGGMGQVVRATHLQLGQPVAMKFLLPEVLHDQTVVQRFLREAQAAVRLRSEHVARVIDVGTLDNGAPFMVLEYLEGLDLSQFPRDQLSPPLVVDMMLQACEALAEAHSIGIVHRDIKPANLFVTRRTDGSPLVKILDFGISKASNVDHKLTSTRAIMGTPAYMSPEQMNSTRDADARSDLWSLGVVMYELLEGVPPFEAETMPLLFMKVMTAPLPPFSRPIPPRLAAIVYRCLEKDPARRFAGIGELVRALAPFAQSPTQAAVSVQRTGGPTATPAFGNPTPPAMTVPSSPSTISAASGSVQVGAQQRRRWPIVVGLIAGLCIVGGIVIAASTGSSSKDGTQTAGSAEPVHAAVTPAATPPPVTPTPVAPPPVTPVAAPPDAAVTVVAPDAAAVVVAPPATPPPATPSHPATPHPKHPPRTPASGTTASPASGDDDILGARH